MFQTHLKMDREFTCWGLADVKKGKIRTHLRGGKIHQ